ncbi:putative nuclease HARBI1 [Photinus pyralis]|uniref:putative nuclease HARBI1 n=1 Tax=Photinus pyralis TaxID=7054 RepID=UPI001266F902|nr:putative nuclease HARBI1 [Photinus pyralis]
MEKLVLMELSRSLSPLISASSSSDDDINITTQRRKRIRIMHYMDTITSYSDEEFKQHFRLKRETALKLIELYRSSIKAYKGGWNHITAEKAIYITIWYLSNMETFRQISDRFDVTLSCAHHVINVVLDFLVNNSSKFIKWPSEQEAKEEAYYFEKKKGIANVIGAIDGCHIKIHRPVIHEQDYVNRKGYHSIILQGVVDSKMKFIDISTGHPGSVHDARVLRKSYMYNAAVENYQTTFFNKYRLVGDSAYPSLKWLVVPYKDNGHLSDEQRDYNYRHSVTRIIVEHAFGALKGRFRRLRYFENLKLTFIIKCVVAACVLHNICLMGNDITEKIYDDEINE